MRQILFGAAAGILFLNGVAFAEGRAKAAGRELARTWCNSCHVIEKGDTSFDDGEIATPFFDMKALMPEKLASLLGKGHGDTPALSKLSPEQVRSLAQWIKAQN